MTCLKNSVVPTRRIWLHQAATLLGCTAAGSLAWVPRAAVAQDMGTDVQVLDLEWADHERSRPLPVRLYLPAVALHTQAVPLVVFSHGIGGSRMGYRYLGAHWAGQGYASLHVQHSGSDRALWRGNVFQILGRLREAAQENEALARVQDVRNALDTLLATPELAARIDARRITAAGHSYGANTTLLLSGALVEREGKLVPLRDERIRAAIAISAPPFYGEGDMVHILNGVRVPSLHITSTEDVIRIPGYFSGPEDREAVFTATGPSEHKVFAMFNTGSHSSFVGRMPGLPLLGATQQLTTAFLAKVFKGEIDALQRWPQEHRSLLSKYVSA